MARKIKVGDLVHVTWLDSAGPAGNEWTLAENANVGTTILFSVGWVFKINKHYIALASSKDKGMKQVRIDLSIPQICIKEIRKLK